MTQTIAQQINWDFDANGGLVIRNKNGNRIYFELADGFWARYEYDSKGKQIYFENSSGFWAKWEYDFEGNEIYYNNSNGTIRDNRPKTCEDSVVEIDDVKNKLTKP